MLSGDVSDSASSPKPPSSPRGGTTAWRARGRGNEPYINHLAEVANLLAAATDGADAELVAAGWLHDTVEDTDTTREELAQKFGDRVAVARGRSAPDDMSPAQGRAPAPADRSMRRRNRPAPS